jgi:DNA-binding transcriptional LysR family regulator
MGTTNMRQRQFDRTFTRRLKLKHLGHFRNECEQQALRESAKASPMTQPAATKLTQELQRIFAVPLFHRDRSGMRFALHGNVVQRHLEILLVDIDNMRAEVDMPRAGVAVRIRLGIVPSLVDCSRTAHAR